MKIGAVILAAGLSRRMGKPKQFLQLNGMPLFMHSVLLANKCGLEPIVLVVGNEADRYRDLLHSYPNIEVIENQSYKEGMASSLKQGIEHLKDKVEAAVVFLADQPFVNDRIVESIVKKYENYSKRGYKIIRPQYGPEKGHPILFDSSLFDEFKNLTGDIGGRSIISKNGHYTKIVSFENTYFGFDIDNQEDYIEAKKLQKSFERLGEV